MSASPKHVNNLLHKVLLGLSIFLSACRNAPPPELTVREEQLPPTVLAHYMPWFQMEVASDGYTEWAHWQWFGKGPKHDPDLILENGQRDIASVFYPLIGPYDSRDPAVLEYHLLTARAAGIEGFIVDWYGPESYSDQGFSALLTMAESCGMKVAVCMEEKACFPPYFETDNRADAVAEAVRHIQYIQTVHASSPAYLHQNGKAVLYVFLGHEEGRLGQNSFSPQEIQTILDASTQPAPFIFRPHWDPAFANQTDGAFAWCGDFEYRDWFYRTAQDQMRDQTIATYTAVASPGFDDRGVWGWGNGPRFRDRRDGLEYQDNWLELIQYQAPAVQIVTWNDFEEGTTIEPTRGYGFTYVDMTESFVANYTGRPADLSDNTAPHLLYQLRRYLQNHPDQALSKQLDSQRDAWVNGGPSPLNTWQTLANTLLTSPQPTQQP